MNKFKTNIFSISLLMLLGFTISESALAAEILHPGNNSDTILTACTDFRSGDTYTDEGGSTGNYLDSNESSIQFCALAGETVSVDFTTFDLQAGLRFCWDNLTVAGDVNGNNNTYSGSPFDGGSGVDARFECTDGTEPGTGASILPGFESLPGQCLTFSFDSDSFQNRTGWIANITESSGCEATSAENIPVFTPLGLVSTIVGLLWFGRRRKAMKIINK